MKRIGVIIPAITYNLQSELLDRAKPDGILLASQYRIYVFHAEIFAVAFPILFVVIQIALNPAARQELRKIQPLSERMRFPAKEK